ncbi:hypothetical protein [Spiroplasma floricola]|uniref:Uncharacterized protein n=1 Tax=Spiroplasma floricola 23-6 TaxID=1336749 RepID=A0A2K8SEN0_9MOLU|nr:hypothetical protein [Spiroplasma floricola]AUB31901.1 hypothetical protein SFLOR_v1c08530 [Spiroplasma floricola 23-6]
MIFLTPETDIIIAICNGISATTLVTVSFILPFLIKKYNDKKQKIDSGERSLADAFDKYFSDQYPKNDFEWYVAEIKAIIKRNEIKTINCTNCKKKCTSSKYMEWFETVDKTIPEVNNFSFKVGKIGFKIELSVLFCYKCITKKVTKKAIS